MADVNSNGKLLLGKNKWREGKGKGNMFPSASLGGVSQTDSTFLSGALRAQDLGWSFLLVTLSALTKVGLDQGSSVC